MLWKFKPIKRNSKEWTAVHSVPDRDKWDYEFVFRPFKPYRLNQDRRPIIFDVMTEVEPWCEAHIGEWTRDGGYLAIRDPGDAQAFQQRWC